MKEFFKKPLFVFGTQYYRAPTPLPVEWESDLDRIRELGLNAIQIRVQWRRNERCENEYTFDDIDRLFDLAAERKLPVIFKFLMENAPDYIYEKYQGFRYGLDGRAIRPGAHGAFYVGGWLPCFDHPEVIRRAEKFVEVMVMRYKDRPELLHWNVWNEPRSKPIGECCCVYSVASYRQFLHKQFGSIEALNQYYGKAWESFDTIQPPAMPHDYAELYLWRQWSWQSVYNRLAFMARKVRALDSMHPVMSHVGGCNVLQDVAGDGSDDHLNASLFDFYGTSLPIPERFDDPLTRCLPFFTCDWLRSVSPQFWVYELYPEWGDWGERTRPQDFRYKVDSSLASGAKGILFWQFRAERLGVENDLAGIVNIDGSFKPITEATEAAAGWVAAHADFLAKADAVPDAVGILYSRHSDLISRIEATGVNAPDLRNFELRGSYTYKFNLQGVYALFHELGFAPRMVDDRFLERELPHLKLIYLPEYFIVSPEATLLLREFVRNGGTVIAEEGLALRDQRTWLQYPWPGHGFSVDFGIKISERFATAKLRQPIPGVPCGDYFASVVVGPETEVLYRTADGRPMATRRGGWIFLATDLGMAYFQNHLERGEECLRLLHDILPVTPDIAATPDVAIRRLQTATERMVWIFNRSNQTYEQNIDGQDISVPADATIAYRYRRQDILPT